MPAPVPGTYMSAAGIQSEISHNTLARVAVHESEYRRTVNRHCKKLEQNIKRITREQKVFRESLRHYSKQLKKNNALNRQEGSLAVGITTNYDTSKDFGQRTRQGSTGYILLEEPNILDARTSETEHVSTVDRTGSRVRVDEEKKRECDSRQELNSITPSQSDGTRQASTAQHHIWTKTELKSTSKQDKDGQIATTESSTSPVSEEQHTAGSSNTRVSVYHAGRVHQGVNHNAQVSPSPRRRTSSDPVTFLELARLRDTSRTGRSPLLDRIHKRISKGIKTTLARVEELEIENGCVRKYSDSVVPIIKVAEPRRKLSEGTRWQKKVSFSGLSDQTQQARKYLGGTRKASDSLESEPRQAWQGTNSGDIKGEDLERHRRRRREGRQENVENILPQLDTLGVSGEIGSFSPRKKSLQNGSASPSQLTTSDWSDDATFDDELEQHLKKEGRKHSRLSAQIRWTEAMTKIRKCHSLRPFSADSETSQ